MYYNNEHAEDDKNNDILMILINVKKIREN